MPKKKKTTGQVSKRDRLIFVLGPE